ncbi:MAG TPA: ADP-forming succinate--CoA ligase subunit beta [Thermomicrobiales bacterium]
MNIHEYQAAELFAKYGLPVNPGRVARTPEEAAEHARAIGGTVVLKAQVHSGGRGKAGGVKLAKSPEEAAEKAGQILGLDIRGHIVHQVLVAPGADIAKEYYLGAILDREARGITMMGSSEGGVDIEEVAQTNPEAIIKVTADPLLGLQDYEARELAFGMGIAPADVNSFVAIVKQLYAAFVGEDASLAEINPLIRTGDGKWAAIDSKMVLDDSALYRHPGLESLRDLAEENATEIEAKKAGLAFVKLDGEIGCMVNGAGLSMATMDAIKFAGGSPANFLDVGGGATSKQVVQGLQLILADPNVTAILFNIFGGIARCDVIAQGIVDGLTQIEVKVPLVVRLLGTNQEEGRRILRDSGFDLITADTMSEAAQKVVAAAGGSRES